MERYIYFFFVGVDVYVGNHIRLSAISHKFSNLWNSGKWVEIGGRGLRAGLL